MRPRHATKLLSSVLALIALACAWFYLAPTSLGGSTTYVVTDGISMEPHFHAGDLALVRSQSSYRVGEIVAYNSHVLHRIVLHRIIGRAGSLYVFKGDNNNFVDFEHPAQGQLIGALWVHIPGVGARLQSLRSPALVGVLLALSFLLFAGAAFTHRRRRGGRGRRRSADTQLSPGLPATHASEPMLGAVALALVALLPLTALALLAFTRPATSLQPTSVAYQQSGRLSYTANAAPGPAYPGDRAVTGDPLFTRVLSTVNLRFDYRFQADAPHSLAGVASLGATVTSTSGWQTSLALSPARRFRGDQTSVTGTLDLNSLQALVHRFESMTDVSGSYTLTVIPHVRAVGSLDSMGLAAVFAPQVHFSLNPLELQPASSASAGGSGAAGAGGSNPFTPSASGSLAGRRYEPLFLSLKLVRLQVGTARAIALGGIAIILCVLAATVAYLRTRRRDESATIRARYGRMIVPVAHVWQPPGVAAIDVSDMEALVRIAEHYDRSILCESGEQGDEFWVTDESGYFRYAVGAPAAAAGVQRYAPAHFGPIPEEAFSAPAAPITTEAPAASFYEAPDHPDPAWALQPTSDRAPLDPLVGDVYCDELELGGLVSASMTPGQAPDGLAVHATTGNGWAGGDELHVPDALQVSEDRTDEAYDWALQDAAAFDWAMPQPAASLAPGADWPTAPHPVVAVHGNGNGNGNGSHG